MRDNCDCISGRIRGKDLFRIDPIQRLTVQIPVSPPIVKARVKIHLQNRLTVRFLEGLLSSQTTSLEDAKSQAQSLLVFV